MATRYPGAEYATSWADGTLAGESGLRAFTKTIVVPPDSDSFLPFPGVLLYIYPCVNEMIGLREAQRMYTIMR